MKSIKPGKNDKKKLLPVIHLPPKVDDNEYKNKSEALLFASGKKLDVEFISNVIGTSDKSAIKRSLIELKKDYEAKNSSLMIVEEGNFWKITVKEKYLPIVRKIVADTELSKSVMETLAVIAWKSPALQSDVIKIRTNKAYDHIDALLDSGFITKEKRGRSFVVKITNKFYEYFDVEGKENIREIFSKIKEKPVQKKVDEFKEDAQRKIGSLKVVSSLPDNSIKNAEMEIENKKFGSLELYDEDNMENIPQTIEKEPKSTEEIESEIEKASRIQEEEEKLRQKTRDLVKKLLDDKK